MDKERGLIKNSYEYQRFIDTSGRFLQKSSLGKPKPYERDTIREDPSLILRAREVLMVRIPLLPFLPQRVTKIHPQLQPVKANLPK